MAVDAQYTSAVLMGAGRLSATSDTNRTAPTTAVTIVTAGASGSKIEEIVGQATGTTAAGTINLFLFDGTNYQMFDQIPVVAITAATGTQLWRSGVNTVPYRYSNLLLASGWSLRATQEAQTAQVLNVVAFGGSY